MLMLTEFKAIKLVQVQLRKSDLEKIREISSPLFWLQICEIILMYFA